MSKRYTSFWDFYPFYLSQHRDPRCRTLHYVGSLSVVALLVMAIVLGNYWMLWLLPILGYGAAWIGHFVFERNRPATFEYPFYSFIADWVMLAQWLTGRR
ncbi:DUF962 domain-containing protein [Shewanella sp. Isolate8]|uniref:DUF962 domain-containing protein n=1 Tax=Shewanella sp. Isolate8 TaxID=2908529 RepID=UPI001EFDBCE4|nr:DUF962 domain-containing protein [Shewanella sp. Isolate8]MCG9747159.1 DUF962 domain-containing protein [Shewanella sp. Isolate8]